MTIYVLGAGASHHAGYPLANALGNELRDWMRRNRPEGDLGRSPIEELDQLYGGLANFEQILTELDECPLGSCAAKLDKNHIGNVRGRVRICVPEFFDGIRQRPALLYDRLARERVRTGDVIITFNYDLACERALKTAGSWEISDGYGFQMMVNAILPPKVRVLKLHGSTDWAWPLFGGRTGFFQMPGSALPDTPVIRQRKDDLEYLGYPSELSDQFLPSTPLGAALPAVIMGHKRFYMETPLGREGEEFWNDLWVQAKCAIRSADSIVVIGYSMPTADTEARKLLFKSSNKDASISVWCGQASAALRDEFIALGFTQVETGSCGRFEDFLDS